MAEPSLLPSATEVAHRCYDAARVINPEIPEDLANNLEALADYFFDRGALVTVFIRRLVPWGDLVRRPNRGHEAIADFLLTEAIDHAVTTNFDWLIEVTVWQNLGGNFTASLNGDEAVVYAANYSPLIKLHGCGNRDPDNTLWTKRQLTCHEVASRTETLRNWLSVNLREKDLVVVGFWSDWPHLTNVLEGSLAGGQPSSVTVVDPGASEALEAKAPELWRALHGGGIRFEHIRMSGDAFLDELREAFSSMYVRQLLEMGAGSYEAKFGETCPPEWLRADDIPREYLYDFRRDAEGQPIGRPARRICPQPDCERFAFYILALRRGGAQREGAFYRFQGKLVRVINGAGRSLNFMKADYSCELPTALQAEIVACVGAEYYGEPANIVRDGSRSSIVRPSVGGTWLDDHATRALLGL